MKTRIEKDYILIISPLMVYVCGFFSGTPKLARAAAIFPFILFRSEDEVVEWTINHERIHFRQQLETVFIGFIIFMILEILYARLILRKTFKEAYLWCSSEQEAYRNQYDQDYLKQRGLWSQFKYLKDKKSFTFGNPGKIIFIDKAES
jgi:hypothetical protein